MFLLLISTREEEEELSSCAENKAEYYHLYYSLFEKDTRQGIKYVTAQATQVMQRRKSSSLPLALLVQDWRSCNHVPLP